MIQFINRPELIDEDRAKSILTTSAMIHKASIERLVYFFISRDQMLDLNLKYLNHNTHTDILAFPYGTKKNIIAEVYISIDQLKENAKEYNQSIENEGLRLISHGFLHLIGYLDKTKSQQDKMSKEEDKMINMFHVKQ